MTVQIVEISGQKMAVLPIADYERLVDMVEDRLDSASAVTAAHRRENGEQYVPLDIVDQIMAGENPLRVWRTFRGLTQEALGQRAGVGEMAVSRLELGKHAGSMKTWRALAEALGASVDDIIPAI